MRVEKVREGGHQWKNRADLTRLNSFGTPEKLNKDIILSSFTQLGFSYFYILSLGKTSVVENWEQRSKNYNDGELFHSMLSENAKESMSNC